ncbi:MAG: ABC transporter ATP-binding protein [Bacteroidetes bacterium]|nr:ABC transporter ATP-binding protein [Bacteroidota bacterium]
MATEIVISAKNLTKTYKFYNSHYDRVKETFNPFGKKYHQPFNALLDVSFDVKKGNTLGIVGCNGSGKSTLLQIVCGILQPSSGSIQVNGRISAILELGAGFSPEFTGRQNVYLNAQILGLNREEMDTSFDDIVAFADIKKFIDQPVKTYSSGMYIRLAFAVAINVKPDILIIDEALAVGDEAFQRKCFAQIKAFQKKGGTILFVSHNTTAVVELCNSAILLDHGEVLIAGAPKLVVSRYHKLLFSPTDRTDSISKESGADNNKSTQSMLSNKDKQGKQLKADVFSEERLPENYDSKMLPKSTIWYENRGAIIEKPVIITADGFKVNTLNQGDEYIFSYNVSFQEKCFNVRFAMIIKTTSGFELGGAVTSQPGEGIDYVKPGTTINVHFHFSCLLLPAIYFMNAGVLGMISGKEVFLHRGIDVAMFRVLRDDNSIATATVDFNISSSFSVS